MVRHQGSTIDTRCLLNMPFVRSSEHSTSHVDHARIPKYNLNIEPVEVVSIMKGMENSMKWPHKPNNLGPKRDTTK